MSESNTAVKENTNATGKVAKAFGNLLQVAFDGNIRQGEVAMVHLDGLQLKSEVIEIAGNEAKMQVFEDTRGVKLTRLSPSQESFSMQSWDQAY